MLDTAQQMEPFECGDVTTSQFGESIFSNGVFVLAISSFEASLRITENEQQPCSAKASFRIGSER